MCDVFIANSGRTEVRTTDSAWKCGLGLEEEIGAQWPVNRWQREEPEQRHATLRSNVGLFIYNSRPD